MTWDWRADLAANSPKRGRWGAVQAFILDPSFTFVVWTRFFMFLKDKKTPPFGTFASLVYAHIIKTFASEITFEARSIGKALKTPHPFGIVIGAGAEIGDYVTLFHNVTFGRKILGTPCQIRVGNRAMISAGAVVLGPLEIGEDAIIGANAVVLSDVLPKTTVVGAPARAIKTREAP